MRANEKKTRDIGAVIKQIVKVVDLATNRIDGELFDHPDRVEIFKFFMILNRIKYDGFRRSMENSSSSWAELQNLFEEVIYTRQNKAEWHFAAISVYLEKSLKEVKEHFSK